MIFACQHCGGMEPIIIAALAAAWAFFGNWLFKQYRKLQNWWHPVCLHPQIQSNKWLDKNDTPMVTSWCPDCGWHDEGHVYADPASWIAQGTWTDGKNDPWVMVTK
jgi:hypothetical protein